MKDFLYIAFLALSLVACNKDHDIIIESPSQPDPESPSDFPFTSDSFSVLEYLPAPGQFINDVPSGFGEIKTMKEAVDYAQMRLDNYDYVSLGAWGGYIIVKSDGAISNSGDYDFAIGGNSFDSSNEPGIVWVMQDTNGNGATDDVWYELKGSYYNKGGYEKDFWVTYFRPEADSPTPWIDKYGVRGQIQWLGNHHDQPYYYPEWINEDSFTLYGSLLPSLTKQNPITGLWSIAPFEWGYVDNAGVDASLASLNGKTLQLNCFRISDAVKDDGSPANLKYIDFIKVQSAVCGNSGWLGESSTEVCTFLK